MRDQFPDLQPGDVLTADVWNAIRQVAAMLSRFLGPGGIDGVLNQSFVALRARRRTTRFYAIITARTSPITDAVYSWEERKLGPGVTFSAVTNGRSGSPAARPAYERNGYYTPVGAIVVMDEGYVDPTTGQNYVFDCYHAIPVTYTNPGTIDDSNNQYIGAGEKRISSGFTISAVPGTASSGDYVFDTTNGTTTVAATPVPTIRINATVIGAVDTTGAAGGNLYHLTNAGLTPSGLGGDPNEIEGLSSISLSSGLIYAATSDYDQPPASEIVANSPVTGGGVAGGPESSTSLGFNDNACADVIALGQCF